MDNILVSTLPVPPTTEAPVIPNDDTATDPAKAAASCAFPLMYAEQLAEQAANSAAVPTSGAKDALQAEAERSLEDATTADPNASTPTVPMLELLQTAAVMPPAEDTVLRLDTDSTPDTDARTDEIKGDTGGNEPNPLLAPAIFPAPLPATFAAATTDTSSDDCKHNAVGTDSNVLRAPTDFPDPRQAAFTPPVANPHPDKSGNNAVGTEANVLRTAAALSASHAESAGTPEYRAGHGDATAQPPKPWSALAAIESMLPPSAPRPGERSSDARDGNIFAMSAAAHTPQPGIAVTHPAPSVAELRIATPLEHADWGNELGKTMVWMHSAKQQVAEIHISPPELGPVSIKLTMDGSATTAIFTSPHAEVRHIIEAAVPGLREVLADSGITLGQASVTADTPKDGMAYSRSWQQSPRHTVAPVNDSNRTEPMIAISERRLRSMVDLFA